LGAISIIFLLIFQGFDSMHVVAETFYSGLDDFTLVAIPMFVMMGDAIEIARRSGRRLVLCGIVQDERYFAEAVEPHVDGDQVVFLGSVGPQRRAEVLGCAAALLHPIHFDEPFGLSVVEAMACGTPVVAYHRGSMAEVVDEGVTGYLAHDVESSVDAVRAAVRLDRATVHARAAARFGVDRMVEDYLRIYEALLMSASTSPSGA
ncbi:MAG: glycosyltransferase, partial [Streptosporangiaceae bacterium]